MNVHNTKVSLLIPESVTLFRKRVTSFTHTLSTDAPEGDQPFAKESADFLEQYSNKDAITKVNGTDRYARRLIIYNISLYTYTLV
jgi:hypothetical protein